jgi:hypothetical protein
VTEGSYTEMGDDTMPSHFSEIVSGIESPLDILAQATISFAVPRHSRTTPSCTPRARPTPAPSLPCRIPPREFCPWCAPSARYAALHARLATPVGSELSGVTNETSLLPTSSPHPRTHDDYARVRVRAHLSRQVLTMHHASHDPPPLTKLGAL